MAITRCVSSYEFFISKVARALIWHPSLGIIAIVNSKLIHCALKLAHCALEIIF
jgi:hypothetical protein